MPNYRRLRTNAATIFFTVNIADRAERILTEHVDLLRLAFAEARCASPFAIEAIVVLPDHLHCIWTLPEGDLDFSDRWRAIKAAFSRRLPAVEARSGSRVIRRERGIWQRRFWDHVIRDDRDYATHLDYIHYNPVKHGHADRAAAWPYSSFLSSFATAGIPPTGLTARKAVDRSERPDRMHR